MITPNCFLKASHWLITRKANHPAFDSLKTIWIGGDWGPELGEKTLKNQKWLLRFVLERALQSVGTGEILGEETINRWAHTAWCLPI